MAAALSLAGAGVGEQSGLDREIKEFGAICRAASVSGWPSQEA